MVHASSSAHSVFDLMPQPAVIRAADGRLDVTASLSIAVTGHDDARLQAGLGRALRLIEERTGFTFARTPQAAYVIGGDASSAALVIECGAAAVEVPILGEDESYALAISPTQAVLRARNVHGVLHGLATLVQLLRPHADGWSWPAVDIKDRPRFPWRGLMLDVCRHWQPMEVVKRTVDGMTLVKLNVLHLHLTEDQGFRIESTRFPRLHELGSDGRFFTQEEMREIITYAAARCIRVVPEFDIPGHATSWLVGHPELGSAPGPYVIERKWGVFDPVLDPTNPRVYEVLDGFLSEMASLFPDACMHIGGDENNGVHWSANTKIQQFIRDNGLKDNAGLHAFFNNRIRGILERNGKRLVGWDEILHPDLAAGSMVHSWRGPEGIADATARGFATILSNGYYIDLMHPTSAHYLNDPIPPGSTLTPAQQEHVLGGEATMWAEWVTPETIDSRIWPRTAAIAERLWSPQDVRDLDDMYRRLPIVSQRLEEAGMRHVSYIDPALRRLAGDDVTPAEFASLRAFVDLLEPVKVYQRGQHQPDATQATPLTGLVDCARADSPSARILVAQVQALVADPKNRASAAAVGATLRHWSMLGQAMLEGKLVAAPRLREAAPLARALQTAASIGIEAIEAISTDTAKPAGWQAEMLARLDAAAKSQAAVEFPFMPSVRTLLERVATAP